MPWYLYALLTPLFYSITNFIDKFVVDKKIKDPMLMLVVSSLLSGVIGLGILIWRGFPIFDTQSLLLILLAGVLVRLYLVPYLYALKLEDASRVVPLFQLVPIFVLIMAWIFLGETLAKVEVVGALIVVAGGIVLGTERSNGKFFKFKKAFWLMILAGFMYAAILVLIRNAVLEFSLWDIIGYQYLAAAVVAPLLLMKKSIRSNFKQEFLAVKSIFSYLTVNEALAIAAQITEGIAISMVPVAFVSIVTGVQPLILLILGLILSLRFPHIIEEDISNRTLLSKAIAVTMIITGLFFVYT